MAMANAPSTRSTWSTPRARSSPTPAAATRSAPPCWKTSATNRNPPPAPAPTCNAPAPAWRANPHLPRARQARRAREVRERAALEVALPGLRVLDLLADRVGIGPAAGARRDARLELLSGVLARIGRVR